MTKAEKAMTESVIQEIKEFGLSVISYEKNEDYNPPVITAVFAWSDREDFPLPDTDK